MVALIAATTSYANAFDALEEGFETRTDQRQVLGAVYPLQGEGFTVTSLRNRAIAPITILGIRAAEVVSDWRIVDARLGRPRDPHDVPDARSTTSPFDRRTLWPGGALDVTLLFHVADCGSRGLLDGEADGPLAITVSYSILGVSRTQTFTFRGPSVRPLIGLDCSPGS